MISKLTELIEIARNKPMRRIAVAAAADEEVLRALKEAVGLQIVHPILVGNKREIEGIARSIDFDLKGIETIDHDESASVSAEIAVSLVKKGEADILMKGFLSTSELLKAVLDKNNGIRTTQVLSHVAFMESPYYHKLLGLTDVAMNIAPDLDTKAHIIRNAVEASRRLGTDNPKVAVVAAVETVNPKMEATVHAAKLRDMNREGTLTDCIVEGPLALDIAIDKQAALHKGIDNAVAGDSDIILVPDIEAGNILYKALNFLGGAKSAAIVMGASVPIVLTSRADDERSKLLSIALAAVIR